MKMTMKSNWFLVVAGLLACMIIYLLYSTSWDIPKFIGEPDIVSHTRSHAGHYDFWPTFQAPANEQTDQNWFQKACLPSNINLSIENLSKVLSLWGLSGDSQCRDLLVKFHNLYQVSTRNASVVMPVPFQIKVKKWLGNDETLFKEVYNQEIIHVVNRFTREQTIFNPLRDKRPVLPPAQPEAEYLEEIIQKTAQSCDFCNFKNFTAEHPFHRVENQYAFSASNTFKMDSLHALFALKQHDPLRWSPASFMALMDLTLTWFHKAHKAYPSARFPSVIWDVLPKCGASQVHPHLQGFLDPERYPGALGCSFSTNDSPTIWMTYVGVTEAWRQGAQEYFGSTGASFFTDMAKVSASLGLAASHGSAIAFASLVPRKDHEIIVIAPSANQDFFELLYFALRALVDDLKRYCFSLGMAYPSLEGLEGVIPAYARVITRGVVTDVRSDVSSLELFTATNVNIDPFMVAKALRGSVQTRRNAFTSPQN